MRESFGLVMVVAGPEKVWLISGPSRSLMTSFTTTKIEIGSDLVSHENQPIIYRDF